MKWSVRSCYGTRVLIDIAINSNGSPVHMKDVASRQGISRVYLDKIIEPFVSAGVVRTVKSVNGGVWLARPPREVRLSEVVQLMEGSLAPVQCIDDINYCNRHGVCVTREVWTELKRVMMEVLESTTLEDLVERQRRLTEMPKTFMYYI